MNNFCNICTYEDLFEAEFSCFGMGKVTFLIDFGPWAKGEVIPNLWFDFDEMTAIQYKETDTKTGFAEVFLRYDFKLS